MNIETPLLGTPPTVPITVHRRKIPLWALIACSATFAVIVGFFLHGGLHGQYMDDYTDKAVAHDFATGKWKLTFGSEWKIRPVGQTLINNIGNALPEHEFPVRFGIVMIHLFNVLLLAALVRRLTGSALIGTMAGAFFLMPIFANEALLWFTAGVYNTISLCLLLVGFHCFLNCRSLKNDWRWFLCGIGAWLVMTLVYESGLFTFVLLPFFFFISSRTRFVSARRIWLPALGATYAAIGVWGYLVERVSPALTPRGGPTMDLAFIITNRVPSVLSNLWWLVTDRGRLPHTRFALVSGPLREALGFGWREWLSVPWGPVIVAALLVSLCLLLFFFPLQCDATPDFFNLFALAMIGCAWAALSLVPIILLKSQIVEIRTLYTPSAGLAVTTAALLAVPARLSASSRVYAARLALFVGGVVIVLTSLVMAGVTRTYQLRWYLDQKQLAALKPIVSKIPATQLICLLPIALDERSFGKDSGRYAALDAYMIGVFETPWSARDAVRLWVRDQGIDAVTANRWVKPRISSVQYSAGRPSVIVVQGRAVPIGELLAFTYQQGRIIPLSPLDLDSPDDKSMTAIDLPLVDQLAKSGIEVQPYRLQIENPN